MAAAAYDNIVIYAPDDPNNPDGGGVYSIPSAVYRDPQYALIGNDAAQPLELLSQGVVVANMPNDGTGVGGFCYLLNLPALKPPQVNPAPRLTARQLLVSIKGLLNHTVQVKGRNDIEAEVVELLKKHGAA